MKKASIFKFATKFLGSNVVLCGVICLFTAKVLFAIFLINFPQDVFFAAITRTNLTSFVNEGRYEVGLSPLSENSKLDHAAYLKAQNMVQEQYFNHISPNGVSPWYWFSEAGYDYEYAGENLAVGFYEPKEVYSAWLASPSHRDNLLNPKYTEVGTAVLEGFGKNNAFVVVQLFATPKKAAIQASISPKGEDANVNENVEIIKTIESTEESPKNPSSLPQKPTVLGIEEAEQPFLQEIIYGASVTVTGLLIFIIFAGIPFERKKIIFRAVILLIILGTASFINKEAFVALMPHQVII